MRQRFAALSSIWVVCFLGGCGSGDSSPGDGAGTGATAGAAGLSNVGGSGQAGSGGAGMGGAGGGSGGEQSLEEFCQGKGQPFELPTVDGCTGDLAKQTFLFGVCSCSGLHFAGELHTDSFDSSQGLPTPTGGSVGVNGSYTSSSASTTIGGSLWTDDSVSTAGSLDVSHNLQCGGDLTGSGSIRIHADAYVEGSARGTDVLIDGRLHLSEDGDVSPGVRATGGMVREPVDVKPPCSCDDPVDIGAIVDHFQVKNDNAVPGVLDDQLESVSGDTELTLPCGRYYFTKLSGVGNLTIHLTGRTIIAVGDGITRSGETTFVLDPDAELDLIVRNDVSFAGGITLGANDKPAAVRVYIGGAFSYSGNLTLAGNFYMPNGSFSAATSVTDIYGSVFAKEVVFSGTLNVHYDEAVLMLEGCRDDHPETPIGCTDCHDCVNPLPACIDGTCAKCSSDEDCCPPLLCDEATGLCVGSVIR